MRRFPVFWRGLVPILILSSCAGYNRQADAFYSAYCKGEFEQASSRLDKVRLLKKDRNRLLYLLEKGKVEYSMGHYARSNVYFNEADALMEDPSGAAGDIAVSLLLNPMMSRYRGEAFERYLIHYYKAINYLMLNQTEEALVEARRISLRAQAQEDVHQKNGYNQDPFALMLQGLIYEKGEQWNDAFISYRNAYESYNSNESFYGTHMPLQLKKDLLRMAWKSGFPDELHRYENEFGMKLDTTGLAPREMVVFWENGLAPVKYQEELYFSPGGIGTREVYFTGNNGLRVPLQGYSGAESDLKFLTGHTIRVAYPRYQVQPSVFQGADVSVGGALLTMEKAQDINELALQTLDERRLKELTMAVSRQAIKIIAAEAAKPKEDDKHKDEKRAISAGIDLYRIFSEKADTRNWQSLPQTIYYARVPLPDGVQDVKVETKGSATAQHVIPVPMGGKLVFAAISTQ